MSPGCYRLWEVEAQDVIADVALLWQMIHPEDLPLVHNSVMESAQTLSPWFYAWRIRTPSGREKWLEVSGKPIQQSNGDIIWDMLILDVSERKRSEAERKQAETALKQSEQRFRHLFEATPRIAVQGYNHQRQVIYWNYASEQLYGYTKSEALGQKLENLIIPPEMRQAVIADVQKWLTDGQPIPASELNLMRKDGSRVAVYSNHVLLINTEGEWEMYCVDIDLSDRKQAEEALRESESRYRLVAENMNDLVCLHDLQGHYLYVSPSCELLLGYRYDEMLGQNPYDFFHPDDRDRVYQESHATALSGKSTPTTYRIRQKSGRYLWFETLTKPILDASGQIVQLQTTSRDVTARIEAQNQLKHDALHDALTGLPNRHLLIERLDLAISRAKRLKEYRFAVLFLDLDRFKVINDSLGHLAGDQLLIAIAQKLQSTLRSIDLAARLGGDEFVILLEEVKDIQEAVRATERIFAALQTPLMLEGREIYTTSSIGIVLGTQDYGQASHLLRDADIAMYRAKNKGKARYEIFDAEMHTQALNRLHLENDLRRASEYQEFVLHYQPIVTLNTGCLVGFEALIRWRHPTQGLKFPGDFIAVAEETGLITRLDYWALRTACHQLAAWQTAFPELAAMKVSVNLSAQDLQRADLLEEVDRILAQTRLPGRYLMLELTESMLIEDVESTITLLSQLKARGIQISIDDFGTGYSSLNYLHRLPVDNLKVDRSFVNQIQIGKRNHQIVETIAALSHQLELDAIAEGIETQQQLERLQHLGYKFGQGYLFSQPLSPEAIEALLVSQPWHCFFQD
jgi:diguanylate cyclase (GGDEF)-like protein/PAS domain S-box-containing protein